MSEISLTILGIKNTVDAGGASKDKHDTTMKIGGATIQHGDCMFSVVYTKERIKPLPAGATDDTSNDGTAKPLAFDLAIQNFSMVKQMYHPNEITVVIQIAPAADPNGVYQYYGKVKSDTLKGAFCNCQVKLSIGGNSAGDDFYIHDMVPEYRKDAVYVTMHIFSPDKKLTMRTENRVFVSQRLDKDIMSKRMQTFVVPYTAKEETPSTVAYDATKMKTLLSGSGTSQKEHIFPYLVQYNEDFYDFLARITNRWGEFLYYENGKLNIGYDDTSTHLEDYDSHTYLDMSATDTNVDDYNSEATYDAHVLEAKLKKGGYDSVVGMLGCKKGWDVYVFKKVSGLLSFSNNIIDWAVGTVVDDSIDLGVAEKVSKDKNDKFDEKYFSSTKINNESDRYGDSDKEYNQFTEYAPIANADTYLKVLKGEVAASRNAIQIDFDTDWQDLKLGQVIGITEDGKKKEEKTDEKKKDEKTDEKEAEDSRVFKDYIIVKIEAFQKDRYRIDDNETLVRVTDLSSAPVIYRVTAIAKDATDGRFYPAIIPEGHVRKSDTQIATVTDNDDPARLNRVRVKYDWDPNGVESPWLLFATPVGANGTGFQGRHYKGDKVMVSYHYGNIERPYVSGALPKEVPGGLKVNEVMCNTRGGQVLKMSDGTGAGATNLAAGLLPGVKFVQQFFPACDWFVKKDKDGNPEENDKDVQSRYFEGSIEMCDKYGIWSIKGSTDGRCVNIKSAWGDVNINAYTGITISAPNGDINIKGKNVNIEAGNNITLTSGGNIKDKWYPTLYGSNSWGQVIGSIALILPAAILKKAEQLAVQMIDITFLRNLWETFVKPVEGKLEIKSHRYMMLEAGGASASYPVDAYNKDKRVEKSEDHQAIEQEFERIPTLVNDTFNTLLMMYTSAKELHGSIRESIREFTLRRGNDPEVLPCKSIDTILQDLWGGAAEVNTDFMGFAGILEDLADNPEDSDDIISFFEPSYHPVANLFENNPINYLERAQQRQSVARSSLMARVGQLKIFIDQLRTAEYFTTQKTNTLQDDTLKNALTVVLLANSPLVTLTNDDSFKNLTKAENTLFGDEDKKKLRRTFFKAAVAAYGIKQFTGVNKITGKPAIPVAAPDPYAAGVDQAWNDYVDSLIAMAGPAPGDESVMSKFGADLLSPLKKGIKCWKDLGYNTADHFAFGSEKKGAILFTSSPGTMVLAQDIYRANTDFAETVEYGDDANRQTTEGIVAKIREIMKQ